MIESSSSGAAMRRQLPSQHWRWLSSAALAAMGFPRGGGGALGPYDAPELLYDPTAHARAPRVSRSLSAESANLSRFVRRSSATRRRTGTARPRHMGWH